MTKLKPCGCNSKMRLVIETEMMRAQVTFTEASKYQDTLYGRGVRVHNRANNDKWRCTVCKEARL